MPRRLLGASLLALTALVTLTSRATAKPPDLPDNPTIIVQGQGYAPASPTIPIPLGTTRPEDDQAGWWLTPAVLFNIHPLIAFSPPGYFTPFGGEESCDSHECEWTERFDVFHKDDAVEKPCCPLAKCQPCDKHACAMVDLDASRTVLANLEALVRAAKLMKKAKKLARRGEAGAAAECLRKVGELCPGFPCAELAAEEQQEEPEFPGCNHDGDFTFLSGARQFGMCPFAAAMEMFTRATAAQAEPACGSLESMMAAPVSVSFLNVPLCAAAEELRRITGLPLLLDLPALGRRGVSPHHPVNLSLRHVPAHHVLDVMVRPLGLEPVVKGDVVLITCAMPADSCGMSEKCPAACEPCPRAQRMHERHCQGARVQVEALIKACYLAVEAKRYAKAAELARQAHALDPERVEADPMVYKMHLLHDGPVTEPAVDAPESSTGSLMFGVGVNSDAGLTGGLVLNERNFDLRGMGKAVAAYRDDRAFRGADEPRRAAVPAWKAVSCSVLNLVLCPIDNRDRGGCLTLGPWGVYYYSKHPVGDRAVCFALCGGLPLVWTTPAKAE